MNLRSTVYPGHAGRTFACGRERDGVRRQGHLLRRTLASLSYLIRCDRRLSSRDSFTNTPAEERSEGTTLACRRARGPAP